MKQPRTVYDVLAMLADYHEQRARRYRQLAGAGVDSQADILLEHLLDLETRSSQVIRGEMEHLSPDLPDHWPPTKQRCDSCYRLLV